MSTCLFIAFNRSITPGTPWSNFSIMAISSAGDCGPAIFKNPKYDSKSLNDMEPIEFFADL